MTTWLREFTLPVVIRLVVDIVVVGVTGTGWCVGGGWFSVGFESPSPHESVRLMRVSPATKWENKTQVGMFRPLPTNISASAVRWGDPNFRRMSLVGLTQINGTTVVGWGEAP